MCCGCNVSSSRAEHFEWGCLKQRMKLLYGSTVSLPCSPAVKMHFVGIGAYGRSVIQLHTLTAAVSALLYILTCWHAHFSHTQFFNFKEQLLLLLWKSFVITFDSELIGDRWSIIGGKLFFFSLTWHYCCGWFSCKENNKERLILRDGSCDCENKFLQSFLRNKTQTLDFRLANERLSVKNLSNQPRPFLWIQPSVLSKLDKNLQNCGSSVRPCGTLYIIMCHEGNVYSVEVEYSTLEVL